MKGEKIEKLARSPYETFNEKLLRRKKIKIKYKYSTALALWNA